MVVHCLEVSLQYQWLFSIIHIFLYLTSCSFNNFQYFPMERQFLLNNYRVNQKTLKTILQLLLLLFSYNNYCWYYVFNFVFTTSLKNAYTLGMMLVSNCGTGFWKQQQKKSKQVLVFHDILLLILPQGRTPSHQIKLD